VTAAQLSLRRDLVFSRQETDEGVVFVVKEPNSKRFFRIGEVEHFVARQFDGATPLEAVRRRVEERFGASLTPETLQHFVQSLFGRGLLERDASSAPIPHHARGRIRGNLLYLRLKAFDPDRALETILRRTRWLFTPAFGALCGIGFTVALGITLANAAEIARALQALSLVESLVLAWLTLTGVVVIHEFAHGLTCKYFGGSVHEMGFMLLFFQPALYCNVSDAWLFPERSKRLWVGFAGVYFDLTIWALATLLWRVLDPHTAVSQMAVVVMATTGVKTLFNLNPLLKFDGYYLLSDYLEIPNLRPRAFAHLRARFRALWGAGEAPDATRRERRIYLLYGLAAGAFSLLVLSLLSRWVGGWLVSRYQAWGFVLFASLLVVFLRGPIGRALARLGDALGMGRRRLGALRRPRVVIPALLVVLLLLSALPMQLRVGGEFVVLAAHNADIRPQVDGIIEAVFVSEGDRVAAGDPVASLSDRDLRAELEQVLAEIAEQRARHRLLLAGPSAEEIGVEQTAVEKAEERVRYARIHLDRFTQLHEQQLSSLTEYEEAKEHVAIREKELEEAAGELRLLRAGTRPEEIEAVEAGIARREARHHHLEAQLEHVRITSPIAGIVTTPKVEEKLGEYVARGELIAEVHELERVNAEIAVSEKEIADVHLGQPVTVKARAFPGRSFAGTVTSIAPAATHSEAYGESRITVATQLENPGLLLKPQMTGTAKIHCGERRAIALVTRRLVRYLRVEFWSWW
jgi:putative peptide zinc metalloprotease protein